MFVVAAWILLRQPPEPSAQGGPPHAAESIPASVDQVKPSPQRARGLEQEGEVKALQQFVQRLEAMLEPAAGEDSDRLVLRVPEHLNDASKEDKRAYLVELLHHGEAMVRYTREQQASWEIEAETHPELAAELTRRRADAEEAAQALSDLRARLVAEGALGDAGL